jgi:DNA-binding GntR family transcriptional regulator
MVGEHRALVEAAASTDADAMNVLALEHLQEGYGETSIERRH